MRIKWNMVNDKWKIQRAFTLIELLVVMAIIGILVTIGLVSFQTSQMRSRDAARKSDLKQIASSLELYNSDYGSYPSESSGLIAGCPSTTQTACAWGSGSFTDGKTVYFKNLPKDPSGSQSYLYRVDASGQKFQLFARLENTEDQSLITTAYSCGGSAKCNFAVTSPNTTPTDF